jgi:hypothetical protein
MECRPVDRPIGTIRLRATSVLLQRTLDRAANPVVDEVLADHAQLVAGWTEADFDELYSRVGAGGSLTQQGVLNAIGVMNRKREVLRKVEVLMETGEAELIEGIVQILHRKVLEHGE